MHYVPYKVVKVKYEELLLSKENDSINQIIKDFVSSIFSIVALVLALLAAFAVPVMVLWNAIMPDIFGLSRIGYFEAFGLLALSRLLFSTTGLKKQ